MTNTCSREFPLGRKREGEMHKAYSHEVFMPKRMYIDAGDIFSTFYIFKMFHNTRKESAFPDGANMSIKAHADVNGTRVQLLPPGTPRLRFQDCSLLSVDLLGRSERTPYHCLNFPFPLSKGG